MVLYVFLDTAPSPQQLSPGAGTTCLFAMEVCDGLQQLPEHLLGLRALAQWGCK